MTIVKPGGYQPTEGPKNPTSPGQRGSSVMETKYEWMQIRQFSGVNYWTAQGWELFQICELMSAGRYGTSKESVFYLRKPMTEDTFLEMEKRRLKNELNKTEQESSQKQELINKTYVLERKLFQSHVREQELEDKLALRNAELKSVLASKENKK